MSNEGAKTPDAFPSHCRPKRRANEGERPSQNTSRPNLADNDLAMVNPAPNELRLVLLGKTGAGKSATGNTILGKNSFDADLSMSSVTKECRSESETVEGQKLLLVDTPGFFDTDLTKDEMTQEIFRCLALSSPGPHIFLLVIPIERYTEEQKRTVELILEMFNGEITRHIILIFSHADKLGGENIREFISRQKQPIRELVERFGRRLVAFDNTNPQRDQVKRLLEEVEKLMEQNQNQYFSNEDTDKVKKTMEEAQKIIEERVAERKREIKEEVRKMADDRRSAFTASMNKERLEMQRKKNSIRSRISQIEADIMNEERKLQMSRAYLKKEQENLRRLQEREMKEEEERRGREEKEKEELEIWMQEEEKRRLTGDGVLNKLCSSLYNKQTLAMLAMFVVGLGTGFAPTLLAFLFPAAPVVEAGLSAGFLVNLLGFGGGLAVRAAGFGGGFALRAAGVAAAAAPKLAAIGQCSVQ